MVNSTSTRILVKAKLSGVQAIVTHLLTTNYKKGIEILQVGDSQKEFHIALEASPTLNIFLLIERIEELNISVNIKTMYNNYFVSPRTARATIALGYTKGYTKADLEAYLLRHPEVKRGLDAVTEALSLFDVDLIETKIIEFKESQSYGSYVRLNSLKEMWDESKAIKAYDKTKYLTSEQETDYQDLLKTYKNQEDKDFNKYERLKEEQTERLTELGIEFHKTIEEKLKSYKPIYSERKETPEDSIKRGKSKTDLFGVRYGTKQSSLKDTYVDKSKESGLKKMFKKIYKNLLELRFNKK